MLIYYGLTGDSQSERGAKLKALQAYFKTTDPHALNMLAGDALSASNSDRGKDLIVNSHGNKDTFAGFNAQGFYQTLVSKGFGSGSFNSIYLMACQVGEQAQDNSIYGNFARDLHRVFIQNGIEAKIYAPRGTLTYDVVEKQASGQRYWEVVRMYIKSPEKDYTLKEGILLVT